MFDFSEEDLDNVWFTSDTHLGHVRILELGQGRPFSTIEEHDSRIAALWNSVVKPTDMVFHLGDVALGNWTAGLGLLRGLNGDKHLVPGNHDRVFSQMTRGRQENSRPEYEKTLPDILPETFELTLAGTRFRVSHFPSEEVVIAGKKDRFAKLRPEDDGTPIIHGHTHQSTQITKTPVGTPQLSVGVDANEWTPISAREILKRLDQARDDN